MANRSRIPLNCSTLGLNLLALLLVLLLSHPAAADSDHHSVYLGLGMTSQNAYRTAVNDVGGRSMTGTTYVHVELATEFELGESWGLAPALSYTPWGAKGADQGEKSKLLTVETQLYKSRGITEARTGPGVMFNTLSGEGGTVTLNNGGSTAKFGLPSGSVTTRVFYWSAGVGLKVSDYRLDLDVLVTGPLSARIAFNPMITLSRGFF